MALTDTRLRTLKPEKGKTERLVADGNGLYIRVRAAHGTFTRTWQFRRKTKGRPSITTLGTYPELSVKEARLKAAELATKRRHQSPTVERAAQQWLAERVDQTHRKADQVPGYVDRAIIPELGTMRVRDVEPADIAAVVRDYRDRVGKLARGRTGGRPAARALLAAFKGLFQLLRRKRLDIDLSGGAADRGYCRAAPAGAGAGPDRRGNPLCHDDKHQRR